jgi:hypothetical protein
MMFKSRLGLFCLLISLNYCYAQEYLDGLEVNPVLLNQPKPMAQKSAKESLELPFIDDFSYDSYFPSTKLWQDENMVFINNSYGICPYSVGVATFDAIKNDGQLYSNDTIADKLTSLPINLSEDTTSLILSFYYQPQGIGNAPETQDSLVLQFDAEHTGNWKTVWFSPGLSYTKFINDSLHIKVGRTDTLHFKYVEIPIKDKKYFTSKFRFRFLNYISLAGTNNPSAAVNCDHWNIDFVYLDKNRKTHEDKSFQDIGFTIATLNVLKNFTSIPWSHYSAAIDIENTRISPTVRNNWDQLLTIQLQFFMRDISKPNSTVDSLFAANGQNVSAKENITLFRDQTLKINPIKPDSRASASFVFDHVIANNKDLIAQNDTARTYQYFADYYAYDDGSAENAYGIDANGAKVACPFKTYKTDSLKGFDVYFLQCKNIPADTSFYACVWDENNNLPNKLRFHKEVKRPANPAKVNQFVRILLDSAIVVTGKFFIGWEQTSALRMNVGFDENKIYHDIKLFYNTTGSWMESEFNSDGVLMIRPVLGSTTISSVNPTASNTNKIQLFPNPATNTFSIDGTGSRQIISVVLYNSIGMIAGQWDGTCNSYNISGLPTGIYFVKVHFNEQPAEVLKLIINQ